MGRLLIGVGICALAIVVAYWSLGAADAEPASAERSVLLTGDGPSLESSIAAEATDAGELCIHKAVRVETPGAAPDGPSVIDVRGLVLDQRGAPVEGFAVRGVRRGARNEILEERTWPYGRRPGGEFELLGLEPDFWEITPEAGGFEPGITKRFLSSSTHRVQFTLKWRATIEGVVLDHEGEPTRAVVMARELVSVGLLRAHVERPNEVAVADAAGRFQFESTSARLEIWAQDEHGRAGPAALVTPKSESATEPVELRLLPPCSLRLRTSSPAEGFATITRLPVLFGDHLGHEVRTARLTSEQVVELHDLPTGWNLVEVLTSDGAGGSLAHLSAVELKHDETVELEFAPTERRPVTVHLVNADGSAATRGTNSTLVLPTAPRPAWRPMSESRGDASWVTIGKSCGAWTTPSTWIAPAPGSYVLFTARHGALDPSTAVRFEVPDVSEFDLKLDE